MSRKDNTVLLRKIKDKTVRIGVIGLGYVGLPLAILFAQKGFTVSGFGRSPEKIESLNKGINNLLGSGLDQDLQEVLEAKKFSAYLSSDSSFKKQEIYIICVPTPVDSNKTPDLSDLKQVAKSLKRIDLTNKLIVNESTVAPFTTRDVLGGLGGNYFLVCSPERIDPGNESKTTQNIPKVIGGIDPKSLELGLALYKVVLKQEIVALKSMETAEMSKMLENTYRAVNISLINEFAQLAEKCDIDILDVIRAAKTKWSFHAHYPGIGVGGHCIPVDPYYILHLGKQKGVEMKVVKEGLEKNEEMPHFVAQKVQDNYQMGDKVLVYGLTYKKNVSDLRESPVLEFCESLRKRNIEFSVYDPLLTSQEVENLGFKVGFLEKADIFVVGTDHTKIEEDYKKAINSSTVVIDGRNFFKEKVGKMVLGVGRNLL